MMLMREEIEQWGAAAAFAAGHVILGKFRAQQARRARPVAYLFYAGS